MNFTEGVGPGRLFLGERQLDDDQALRPHTQHQFDVLHCEAHLHVVTLASAQCAGEEFGEGGGVLDEEQ